MPTWPSEVPGVPVPPPHIWFDETRRTLHKRGVTRQPNIPTLRVVAALMAVLALLAGCARGPGNGGGAQGDDVPTTGYVKGAVMLADAQAGGHAGVLVFVAGTGHSARTDENGAYLVSGVPAGEYGFVAERQGYNTLAIDRQRVDPVRQIGRAHV